MHKRICYDAVKVNTNTVSLHKDVLNIIGEYVRPELWLYWMKNDGRSNDDFQHSTVIVAHDIDRACELIFDHNIRHIYKERLIAIPDVVLDLVRKTRHRNHHPDCSRCNTFFVEKNDSRQDWSLRRERENVFCYEHFPDSSTLLNCFNNIYTIKHKKGVINHLILHRNVKLKNLFW